MIGKLTFRRPQTRHTNAPKLRSDGSFTKARDIGHSSLKPRIQVEFGIVVDLTFEACSWLLGQVIVGVEEGSFGESFFYDRVDCEGLVLGHCGELSGLGVAKITDSVQS